MNAIKKVFNNNDLMQKIYEFDNTYHMIYNDIMDICYTAFKNHWNNKLKKIINDEESLRNHWNNFYISCKFNYD
jgi:hypothetical protein